MNGDKLTFGRSASMLVVSDHILVVVNDGVTRVVVDLIMDDAQRLAALVEAAAD